MHRYEELEILYYKRLILKIVFFIFVFIAFILLIILKPFSKENNPVDKKINHIETKEVKKEIKITKAKEIKDKLIFVLPKLSKEDIEQAKPPKKPKPIKSEFKKPQIKKEVKTNEFNVEVKEVSLEDLINSYKISPNYDLALTIANEFFKKNNLKSAQIWAIKANNLEPSRVESWILFADILLKENKKKKALEVLNIYKNQFGDNPKIEEKIRSIDE